MREKSAKFLAYTCSVVTLYYFIMFVLYFYSIKMGNEGINVTLFGGGDDGVFYYNQAVNYANGIKYEAPSIHVIVYGVIFKVLNSENVVYLRMYNYIGYVLLIIILLILLKKICNNLNIFLDKATILVIMLVMYPSLILNTTLSLYRDIWIYFFFTCSLYFFISIFIKRNRMPFIINGLLLLISILMLYGYRKYALMSFLIGSGIYLILAFNKKSKINIKKVSVLLFIGFSLFYILFKDFKVPFVGLSFNDVLAYRQAFIDIYSGGSQMNISLIQSNIILFYLNYLYSFFSNVIGPFFWQVNSISTLAIMLTEGVVFILITIVLYKNRMFFSNTDKYILIQSLVWFILISLSNDNFGAGSRLRIVGWLPLVVLFVKFIDLPSFFKKIKRKIKI